MGGHNSAHSILPRPPKIHALFTVKYTRHSTRQPPRPAAKWSVEQTGWLLGRSQAVLCRGTHGPLGGPAPRPWHHAYGSGAGVAYGLWGDSSFSLQDSTCSTVCSPRSPTGSVPARTIPSLLLPSVEMASGVHSLQHPSLLIQWLGPTLCSLLNRLLTFYSVDGLKLCHIFKFWLCLV